jgi:hypothetical protein
VFEECGGLFGMICEKGDLTGAQGEVEIEWEAEDSGVEYFDGLVGIFIFKGDVGGFRVVGGEVCVLGLVGDEVDPEEVCVGEVREGGEGGGADAEDGCWVGSGAFGYGGEFE